MPPIQGLSDEGVGYPGLRPSPTRGLPWAIVFRPVGAWGREVQLLLRSGRWEQELGELLGGGGAGGAELVDDAAGGGHREFHGFREGRTGGEAGREVGGHGIAGADDVDGSAKGQGRTVVMAAVGGGTDDAALSEGDEDGALVLLGKFGGGLADGVEVVDGMAGETREFGGVHLEDHLGKAPEGAPGIGDDGQAREAFDDLPYGGEHGFGDNAGASDVDLVHEDDGIEAGGECAEVGSDAVRDGSGGCVPVLEVQSAQFTWRFAGRVNEGLGIGEGVAVGRLDEVVEVDAWLPTEGTEELPTFAVVAGDADRAERTNAEGDQVVQDRSGGAGLAADAGDVVDGETGFDGDLAPGGVDVEVAVEAEVSHHGEAERGVAVGEGGQTFGVHASCFQRWWMKARLSDCT